MNLAHYKVLDHTKTSFAVQINPAAFRYTMFSGTPHRDAILALNVNYSWLGLAIGHVRSEYATRILTLADMSNIRPCLCVAFGTGSIIRPDMPGFFLDKYSLVAQAGPTLVWDSKIVATESAKREKFRADAIRKTNHVAIGCNAAGKVIAAYISDISITDLGYYMQQHGAIAAMKCDGGNASALWFREDSQEFKYGANKSCKAGLQFLRK